MKAIISSGGNAGREEKLKNGNVRIYNDEGTGYVERDAEGNLVRSGSSGTEDWNKPGASPVIKYGGGSYNSDTGEYRIRNGMGEVVRTGQGSRDDYDNVYSDMVRSRAVSDSLGRVGGGGAPSPMQSAIDRMMQSSSQNPYGNYVPVQYNNPLDMRSVISGWSDGVSGIIPWEDELENDSFDYDIFDNSIPELDFSMKKPSQSSHIKALGNIFK